MCTFDWVLVVYISEKGMGRRNSLSSAEVSPKMVQFIHNFTSFPSLYIPSKFLVSQQCNYLKLVNSINPVPCFLK